MHWTDPVIRFFRLSVCLWTDRLSNNNVHIFLPIFTKFCMRLRNVVASTPIVYDTNRKYFSDLEMCGFRFQQFLGYGDHIFQQISTATKSHIQIKFSNADFILNETGNKNRISEICKFRIRFRLVRCGTITDFAKFYTRIRMWSSLRLVFRKP